MHDTPFHSPHQVRIFSRAQPLGPTRRTSISWWRPALLASILFTFFLVFVTSDIAATLTAIHAFVDDLGPWGPIAFIAIFLIWVILALPGTWLSAMAGALWGVGLGFLIAMTGAILGAAACFLIARYFARQPVARLAQRSTRFCKLDELTKSHGAIVVILVRLIPIFPYNITNYAFGITAVSFWTYIIWSFICMIPGTLFVVAGSDAIARALAGGEVPPILIAIAISSLALLTLLIILARRHMRKREECLQNPSLSSPLPPHH